MFFKAHTLLLLLFLTLAIFLLQGGLIFLSSFYFWKCLPSPIVTLWFRARGPNASPVQWSDSCQTSTLVRCFHFSMSISGLSKIITCLVLDQRDPLQDHICYRIFLFLQRYLTSQKTATCPWKNTSTAFRTAGNLLFGSLTHRVPRGFIFFSRWAGYQMGNNGGKWKFKPVEKLYQDTTTSHPTDCFTFVNEAMLHLKKISQHGLHSYLPLLPSNGITW